MIYSAALTLHIIGIVLFAGSVFIDFFITEQFWIVYSANQNNAGPIDSLISKIQKIGGWGGRLIILAGILMMYVHPIWLAQTWFRVKMGILVVVLINGAFRQKAGKLLQTLASGTSQSNASILRSRLKRLQLISMALLTLMFILSVFKFNG